jgi:hypothetical protein
MKKRGGFVVSATGTSQLCPLLRDAISDNHFVLFFLPDLPLPEYLVMQNVPLGRWVTDSKNFAGI